MLLGEYTLLLKESIQLPNSRDRLDVDSAHKNAVLFSGTKMSKGPEIKEGSGRDLVICIVCRWDIKPILRSSMEAYLKYDENGRLKQEIILVISRTPDVILSFLSLQQYPNEYIRGAALCFLQKIDAELLELLVATCRSCPEHRHSHARENAMPPTSTLALTLTGYNKAAYGDEESTEELTFEVDSDAYGGLRDVTGIWEESREEAFKYFASLEHNREYAAAYTSLGVYYSERASPPDSTQASKRFQETFELDAHESEAVRRLAEGFADEREWDLVEVVARRTIDGEGGVVRVKAWAWKALSVVELVKGTNHCSTGTDDVDD
ncbi:hypothetical protein EV424DRAFT_1350751 [Suillus variegatus]|nr:hypothetical protein EV424DRAFT_1350751 [Suillus variegatus]